MSWPLNVTRTSSDAPARDLVADPGPATPWGVDPFGSFDHAWCSACVWRGPGRRARASAREDLQRHVLASHQG